MAVEISSKRTYALNWKKTNDIVPIIGECICDLQASLAQYMVISSVKYMELKESVQNEEEDETVLARFKELDPMSLT